MKTIIQNILATASILILLFVILMPLESQADVLVTLTWNAPTERVNKAPYEPKEGATYEVVDQVTGDAVVVPYTQLSMQYTKPDGYNGSFAIRAVDSKGLASEYAIGYVNPLPPVVDSSPPGRVGLRITIEQL